MSTLFAKGISTEYIFIQFHICMDITSIQISTVRIWIVTYDEDWDYCLCTSFAPGIYVFKFLRAVIRRGSLVSESDDHVKI